MVNLPFNPNNPKTPIFTLLVIILLSTPLATSYTPYHCYVRPLLHSYKPVDNLWFFSKNGICRFPKDGDIACNHINLSPNYYDIYFVITDKCEVKYRPIQGISNIINPKQKKFRNKVVQSYMKEYTKLRDEEANCSNANMQLLLEFVLLSSFSRIICIRDDEYQYDGIDYETIGQLSAISKTTRPNKDDKIPIGMAVIVPNKLDLNNPGDLIAKPKKRPVQKFVDTSISGKDKSKGSRNNTTIRNANKRKTDHSGTRVIQIPAIRNGQPENRTTKAQSPKTNISGDKKAERTKRKNILNDGQSWNLRDSAHLNKNSAKLDVQGANSKKKPSAIKSAMYENQKVEARPVSKNTSKGPLIVTEKIKSSASNGQRINPDPKKNMPVKKESLGEESDENEEIEMDSEEEAEEEIDDLLIRV